MEQKEKETDNIELRSDRPRPLQKARCALNGFMGR